MDALKLARAYAKAKGTTVLDYKDHGDGTFTVILESGPKLRLNEADVKKVVSEVELAKAVAEAKEAAADEVLAGRSKAGKIDLSDGVDAGEASLAGKTLNKARKERA